MIPINTYWKKYARLTALRTNWSLKKVFSISRNGNLSTFIHLDKHLEGTLWIKFNKDHSLLLQMKSFGPRNFEFHAWVEKSHFVNFADIGWLAGFPCPVRAALHLTIKYELKTPTVEMACDLGLQNELHTSNMQN